MPRSRHYTTVFDSDASPTSSLYAAAPSTTRRSASPPSSVRRPSPHAFACALPRLHVHEPLSAAAATRLMLTKWDLMDAARREDEDRRSRRGRTRSVPTAALRSLSRVKEYELWQPERERIRLAQVEMERRADKEKEPQLVQAELDTDRAGVQDRGATPGVVVSALPNDDDGDWRSTGRKSATTSMASMGSPPPQLDDSDSGGQAPVNFRGDRRHSRRDADLRRSQSAADADPSEARKEPDRTSPGKSPSPATDDESPRPAAATDLLGAAADAGFAAAEHVGEAVSSALSRVGALFSARRA
ncbi:hypothetical protein JCM3770_005669 [Rhodotorula araucariae]